jgi:polar amino acid transport system substrate-binding protein
MKRFNALLLCTAGALTSFSAAAFQQPGKSPPVRI